MLQCYIKRKANNEIIEHIGNLQKKDCIYSNPYKKVKFFFKQKIKDSLTAVKQTNRIYEKAIYQTQFFFRKNF